MDGTTRVAEEQNPDVVDTVTSKSGTSGVLTTGDDVVGMYDETYSPSSHWAPHSKTSAAALGMLPFQAEAFPTRKYPGERLVVIVFVHRVQESGTNAQSTH